MKRLRRIGCLIPEPENLNSMRENSIPEPAHLNPEPANLIPEAGNRNPEGGDRNPGPENLIPACENSIPEPAHSKPEPEHRNRAGANRKPEAAPVNPHFSSGAPPLPPGVLPTFSSNVYARQPLTPSAVSLRESR